MRSLQASSTIAGVAGTASAVTYTISLDEIAAGVDAFKNTQGFLPTSATVLYTATAVMANVKTIELANTTASPVTGCKLFVGGIVAANQITGTFTMPANGTAIATGELFQIFDSTGALVTTMTLTLTGDVTGSGSGSIATTLATVNANVGSFGDSSHVAAVTVNAKGLVTAASSVAVTPASIGADVSGAAAAAQAASQPLDTTLTNLAAQDWVLDSIPVGTGTNTVAQRNLAANQFLAKSSAGNVAAKSITDAGLAFVAAADAAAETALLNDSTFALPGRQTAAEKIAQNSIDGRTSTGTNPRVFRPGDYMVGNTYDPTGVGNSTSSFSAMMTAVNAWNDRCIIELAPGVFNVDPDILAWITTWGGAPTGIRGPGRGICVLVPRSAGTNFIRLPGPPTDGVALSGFAIYNTSGTPFSAGTGVLTNGCSSVTLENMLFVDLFRDVQVSGRPVASTTNGTTTVSGINPVLTASDVGRAFNGVGIPTGTTISSQTGSGCVLNNAATVSTSATRYVGNSIKVSLQRALHSQTNGNASSVGVYVENGDAGDTYIGPDVVMSNSGATRRRASVELVASGHYEITQANLTGSAQGILEDPQASQIVAFGFHTAVLCDSCSINGMTLSAPTATSTVKNIKSVNSWYSGTTTGAGLSGVVTSGTAGGIINGVTHTSDRFLNNQRHGYEHAFGTDFRWEGCDMKGNNAVNAAIGTGYDGLNVAASVSNFSVNGGKFGGTDTLVTSPNQRYGINIAVGAGDSINIQPSDLSGNRDGPLQCGATGTNVFIAGCPGLAAPKIITASVTVTAAQILIGNITVPKNSLRIGSCFAVTGGGVATNTATTPGGTFTLRAGPTTLTGNKAAEIVFTGPTTASTLAAPFTIFGMFTVRTIGAGGTIIGTLNVIKDKANHATPAVATDILLETVAALNATVAIDTTVANLLELTGLAATATWIVNSLSIIPINY